MPVTDFIAYAPMLRLVTTPLYFISDGYAIFSRLFFEVDILPRYHVSDLRHAFIGFRMLAFSALLHSPLAFIVFIRFHLITD